jgi:hypothetical protein
LAAQISSTTSEKESAAGSGAESKAIVMRRGLL